MVPKRPGQRYRVDSESLARSRWVRVGRDHYALSPVRATFTPIAADGRPDAELPIVHLKVALDEANAPQVYDMQITAAGAPLAPTSIRVPLRAMARAGIAVQSYRSDDDRAYLVALSGDTFVIGESSTVEHLAPERLEDIEREFRAAARHAPKRRISDEDHEELA